MKHLSPIILLSAAVLMTTACKKKQESDIIITKKQTTQKVASGPQKMSDYSWSKTVDWVGKQYTIQIQRKADESLPMAQDESGNKYYDNQISVKVMRADGSVFFNRSFKKDDFRNFTNNAFGKNGALLGIVFDKAEGDHLYFAASVGSPDTMSDEYIPLLVTISRYGDVGIKNDTQLDTGSEEPRDELEAAEAEGM